MKITIKQSDFSQALSIVSRAVSTRPTLPVLSHVLLHAEGSGLLLAGTDLETFITTTIPAQVEEEGSFTVPARLLVDFVNALPNEFIEMELEDGTGTLHLVCGKNDADIKGTDAQEFPILPEQPDVPQFYLDAPLLAQALEQTVFSAATDESRPILTGVYFRLEGEALTLAAADGFRLSVTSIGIQSVPDAQAAIIPAKALAELAKLLPKNKDPDYTPVCRFSILKSRAHFGLPDGTTLDSQLIEGNFINYRQIVPTTHQTSAIVNVEALSKVLRTANIFGRQDVGLINLHINELSIAINAPGGEAGDYDSQVHAVVDGPGLDIALNVKFLLQAVQACTTEDVMLYFNDKALPVKLTSEAFTHVIMPMHVKG